MVERRGDAMKIVVLGEGKSHLINHKRAMAHFKYNVLPLELSKTSMLALGNPLPSSVRT